VPNADAEIERKLREAVARWSLDAVEPFADTATSRVFRARTAGRRVALKILKPYGADEINGARLMVWYAGEGSAEILGVEDETILMEWLDGGTLGDLVRADNSRDGEATDILCEVVARLHRRRSMPLPPLQPLEQSMRPLLHSDLAFLPAEARPRWERARQLVAGLLASTANAGPLHGDLHHDNVLRGAASWQVIDPKGLIGDPVFDVANIFRNPYGADHLAFDPARIDGLADRFADRFDWPRRRILEWAAGLTAISAIWNSARPDGSDWERRMLPLLLAAIDRQR
jgi:streptomycin 6-kinase